MTTLLLIRHAHALERANTRRAPLSTTGIKQAEALAGRLAPKKIHVIYTSSYIRGKHTAEIIAQPHKSKTVETTDVLTEVDFRIKKRLSLGTFKELKNFYTKPEIEQIKNLLLAQKRVLRLLNYLLKSHPEQTIAVITHGNIIRAIILGILELKLSRWQRFKISHGSISTLMGTTLENLKIISINDTAHLEPKHLRDP